MSFFGLTLFFLARVVIGVFTLIMNCKKQHSWSRWVLAATYMLSFMNLVYMLYMILMTQLETWKKPWMRNRYPLQHELFYGTLIFILLSDLYMVVVSYSWAKEAAPESNKTVAVVTAPQQY